MILILLIKQAKPCFIYGLKLSLPKIFNSYLKQKPNFKLF